MNETYARARRSLSRRDPILRQVIRTIGPCTLQPEPDYFVTLVRAIASQQLSTKAAATIMSRVIANACGGTLTPAALASASEQSLRQAGLSNAKTRYVRTVAQRVHEGTLLLDALVELDDEAVIERLIELPGVGRWTAQMYLIFTLGRLNVLPVDDLGFRNGVKRHYQLSDMPDRQTLQNFATKWAPYCSVATWYIWRSLAPPPRAD